MHLFLEGKETEGRRQKVTSVSSYSQKSMLAVC